MAAESSTAWASSRTPPGAESRTLMPRASSVAEVVGAIAATVMPWGTSMRAAAARLVTNSTAAPSAPMRRNSGQSRH